ncbi:MAG: hypothetical protein R3F19_19475 [Verrucomicrobiales bacterium]
MNTTKLLILATVSLAIFLLPSSGAAQEPIQSPVHAGQWYTFWLEAPLHKFAGTPLAKNRAMHVKVHEVHGDWVKVDLYYDMAMAAATSIVESMRAEGEESPWLTQYLKDSGTTKEAFRKETEAQIAKIDENHRRSMWVNMAKLEAITPLLPVPIPPSQK